uniref:Uncharacterized protein n=1 Tax=Anguilla anguilla TaxID=7936 RepID=A0A0E9T2Q9_ANGAN
MFLLHLFYVNARVIFTAAYEQYLLKSCQLADKQ